MSWKCTAFVKDLRETPKNPRRITPAEKALLYTLSDYFEEGRGYAWPSLQRIAEESGMSLRSATRLMLALEKDGVLHVDRAVRRSNHYSFIGYHDSAKLTLSTKTSNSAKFTVNSVNRAVNGDTVGTRTSRTGKNKPPENLGEKELTQEQLQKLKTLRHRLLAQGGRFTQQTCSLTDLQWQQFRSWLVSR